MTYRLPRKLVLFLANALLAIFIYIMFQAVSYLTTDASTLPVGCSGFALAQSENSEESSIISSLIPGGEQVFAQGIADCGHFHGTATCSAAGIISVGTHYQNSTGRIYMVQVDGSLASPTPPSNGTWTSATSYSSGTHTVSLVATDGAGGVLGTAATQTVTCTASGPTATIVTATCDSNGMITGSIQVTSNPGNDTIYVLVDNPNNSQNLGTNGGSFSLGPFSSGNHTVEVYYIDNGVSQTLSSTNVTCSVGQTTTNYCVDRNGDGNYETFESFTGSHTQPANSVATNDSSCPPDTVSSINISCSPTSGTPPDSIVVSFSPSAPSGSTLTAYLNGSAVSSGILVGGFSSYTFGPTSTGSYTFQLFDSAGTSISNLSNSCTREDAPNPSGNITSCSSVGQTSLTVNFNQSNTTSQVTVSISPTGQSNNVSTSATSTPFSGLSASTQYTVTLRNGDGTVLDTFSGSSCRTDEPDPDPAPEIACGAVDNIALGENLITITNGLSAGTLEFRVDGGAYQVISTNHNSSNYTHSNLSAGSYQYRFTRNSDGQSDTTSNCIIQDPIRICNNPAANNYEGPLSNGEVEDNSLCRYDYCTDTNNDGVPETPRENVSAAPGANDLQPIPAAGCPQPNYICTNAAANNYTANPAQYDIEDNTTCRYDYCTDTTGDGIQNQPRENVSAAPGANDLQPIPAAGCPQPQPSINIEKFVNPNGSENVNGTTEDTTATAYSATFGQSLVWRYIVTNNGTEELESVIVTDSEGLIVNCPRTILTVSAPNNTMECTATGTATYHPLNNEYDNTGTVNAVGVITGTQVDDNDLSHYRADINPGVSIIKNIQDANGNFQPADTTPGVALAYGQTAVYEVIITNTGNTVLDPVVTDNECTLSSASPHTGADSDSLFEPNEQWRYTCTKLSITPSDYNTSSSFLNTSQVVATPVDNDGTPFSPAVSALGPQTNPAHYNVDVNSEIVLIKYVDDADISSNTLHDANTADTGVDLLSGSTASYTIAVSAPNSDTHLDIGGYSNSGSYQVSDDQCDSSPVFDSSNNGDTDSDELLDPGETWLYTCEVPDLTIADYNNNNESFENTASVSANPVESDGSDIPGQDDLADEDPANVRVLDPRIELKKYVYEQSLQTKHDAQNSDSAVLLAQNSTAYYSIEITNTGNTNLDPTVADDKCTSISNPTELTGDADSIFEPNETWQYQCSISNVQLEFENIASVVAVVVDENNQPIPGFPDLLDDDPANIKIGLPEIELKKYVVVDDSRFDAQTADDSVKFLLGETVNFEIDIVNTGDLHLSFKTSDITADCNNIERIDDGDGDALDLLKPGEKWVYSCQATDVTQASACGAEVDATPVDENGKSLGIGLVSDDDPVNIEPVVEPKLVTTGARTNIIVISGFGILTTALFIANVTVLNKLKLLPARQVVANRLSSLGKPSKTESVDIEDKSSFSRMMTIGHLASKYSSQHRKQTQTTTKQTKKSLSFRTSKIK